MNRRDQIALVTGGASGLGAAIAQCLSAQGAWVYLADVNRVQGEDAAEGLRRSGGQADFIEVDVSDSEAMKDAVSAIVEKHGRLDVMINNAGYSVSGEIQHLDAKDWQRITSVNFLGVVYGSEAAYAVMRAQGHGQIVNIASVFGLVSAPAAAAYVATKHAVVGYTRTLRYEAEAYGIRVNLVCPGFIDTQLFQNAKYVGVRKDVMLDQFNVPLIPVDKAARRILKGMDSNKANIVFPWSVYLYRWLDRHAGFLMKILYRKALVEHRQLKEITIASGSQEPKD
jgi:NAD(P)-dependent dehydrogenase (short-subunit alcohol dehydrogenase family)